MHATAARPPGMAPARPPPTAIPRHAPAAMETDGEPQRTAETEEGSAADRIRGVSTGAADASVEGTTAAAAGLITGALLEGVADLGAEAPTEAEPDIGRVSSEDDSGIQIDAVAVEAGQEAAAPAPESAAPGEAASGGGGEAAEEERAAEPSPAEAVAPATRAVAKRAAASARHQPESAATGAAMAASNRPAVTQRRAAGAAGAAMVDEAETGEVDRQSFRAQLREAIDNAMPPPRDEDEAKRLMDEGGEEAAREVQGALGGHTSEATGALPSAVDEASQPDPASMDGGEEVILEPEAVGEPPAAVSAAPVVPPRSSPQAVDMSENSADADALAAEHNITQNQLERGKEPEFDATLGARSEAEAHNEEGPARLREEEAVDRAGARGNAAGAIAGGLEDFHAERAARLTNVATEQTATSGLTATRKAEITAVIEGIGAGVRADVTTILDEMTEAVGQRFQTAIDEALSDYDDAFDDVRGGFLTRFGDFFTGGGDARFERALQAGRRAFERRIDRAIDEIATYVEGQLARARLRIEEGRTEIDRYIAEELPENEREFAESAATTITEDFDALEGEIDSRRDALVQQMVTIYREGIERRNAREEELRLANRSLWERVYDATVGVVQKVIAFKNMLLGILSRAAAVIEAIIQDPIQFLSNLIAGIKAGLERFMGNIVENLKQALMSWLFGAIEGAGIQLPDTFDLKGFLSIVLQVLGLTKENVRARAVNILGEEMVSRIETGVEMIRILFTEGPAGLWQMLLEKLGDIKETILAEVRSWVITQIIEAGIKWLLGLLNPAGAFVKACMMIYDIVVFFIERGQQIIEAVNAIINALGTIVAGNISAMAQAVEGALNRILPVVIGFLASLLGLGGISDAIRGFIEKVQRPVNRVIDWVINKGVALARGIRGLLGGGQQEADAEEEPEDPEKQMQVAAAMEDLHAAEARQADSGGVTLDEAEQIASTIRANHPVIQAIRVEQGRGKWRYVYRASPEEVEEGDQDADFPFTLEQITRAKVLAFQIVKRDLMSDPAFRERIRAYREQTGPTGNEGEEDREAQPRDVVASSGSDMIALGEAMNQNVHQHGGSAGLPDTVRIHEAAEGGSATTRARRSTAERPNVFVYGGRNSTYTRIQQSLMAAGGALGLGQSGLDRVVRHWFQRRQLPDNIPGPGASMERIRAAAELENLLRHTDTIRMISERMRASASVASTALGLFQSSELAARSDVRAAQGAPDEEPDLDAATRHVTTRTPESGRGAARIMRHAEDTARDRDVRDPRPGPGRDGNLNSQRYFDRVMAAHEREAIEQVQFLLSTERGRDIQTEEDLARVLVGIIREFLLGEG